VALPWSGWVSELRSADSIRDTDTDRKLHYEPALEGLRSILLLFVVVFHAQTYLLQLGGEDLVKGFGVMSTFFMLTGFLVGSIVLGNWAKSGSIGYGKYLYRRVTRIGIPVLLYVVVHLAVAAAMGWPMFTYGRTLGELWTDLSIITFTSNLVPGFGYQVPYDAGQMWSLGVDFQLYLILPLVILFCLTRMDRPSRIVLIAAGVCVLVHIVRFFEFRHVYAGPEVASTAAGTIAINSVYQRPEASLDCFIVGFVLQVLWRKRLLPVRLFQKLSIPAVLAFLAVVFFIPVKSPLVYTIGYPIVLVVGCVLLSESLRSGSVIARALSSYPLRVIGRLSFTLYIWHLFVFMLTGELVGSSAGTAVRLAVGIPFLIVASTLAWLIAERPLVRLPPVGFPLWVTRRTNRPRAGGRAMGSHRDPALHADGGDGIVVTERSGPGDASDAAVRR